MSEPRLISPMLDNFAIGGSISEHHGVRCYPAMENDSDKKYIVKIVSIPASQVQLEAFLLTGVYSSEASALSYFKELAEGVTQEAKVLQKLANLEGFLPYERWQIETMDNAVGYDVYLLSPYRRSLDRYFKRNTMTHLGAVNLGLDLCAAMAVCRRAGYLYVDLKPENIFISDDQEYRIGDLGFVPLSSLKYASLPDKYRSIYTAPEVKDAYSSLNETMDIYAIGLILYQAYNNGQLPALDPNSGEPLPPPMYADYELSEIIMKACATNPEDRWQDPISMGQALVSYMQRNGVNDTPIVSQPEPEPEIPVQEPEQETVAEDTVEEAEPVQDEIAEQLSIFPEEPVSEEDALINSIIQELEQEDAQEVPDEEIPEEESVSAEESDEEETVTGEDSEVPDEADLSFMDDMVSDETAPEEDILDGVEYEELSDEVSDILALADDLIAHETPDPVVAPEPVEIPMPEPILPEPEEEEQEESPAEEIESEEQVQDQEEPELDEGMPSEEEVLKKKSSKVLTGWIIAIALLIGAVFAGLHYYQNYYLQTIDALTLSGDGNRLTVSVTSNVDESLLTVVCMDAHGTIVEGSVKNGIAVFENLNANAYYKVSVKIDGFHKLIGSVDDTYTTPAQINIVSFSATTGTEDGSVILRFTADGRNPDSWTVTYWAEGEEEKAVSFDKEMVTITGLTVGKTYTFRLGSDSSVYIVGQTEITHTAVDPVYAENLIIEGCDEAGLRLSWNNPADAGTVLWRVHCYNDAGYDEYISTEETSAIFANVDPAASYTVEVIADGMSTGSRVYMSSNSLTVNDLYTDISDPSRITVSWNYSGKAPDGGWLLLYNISGTAHQEVIHCEDSYAEILPAVPGVRYDFILQAADGSTVFCDPFSVTTAEAQTMYYLHGMSAFDLTFSMVKTPDVEDWKYYDLIDDDYTNIFTVGQKASFLVGCHVEYNNPEVETVTMFLVKDLDGNIISYASTVRNWRYMWYNGRCELDIPNMPQEAGEYVVEVYFDGMYVHGQYFMVQ